MLSLGLLVLVFVAGGILAQRVLRTSGGHERSANPSTADVRPLSKVYPLGWTKLPPPPEIRDGAAYVWIGSDLLAWGGCDPSGASDCVKTADGFAFDPCRPGLQPRSVTRTTKRPHDVVSDQKRHRFSCRPSVGSHGSNCEANEVPRTMASQPGDPSGHLKSGPMLPLASSDDKAVAKIELVQLQQVAEPPEPFARVQILRKPPETLLGIAVADRREG